MNRSMPDVSIVIPCYNSRVTIAETVRSALAQAAVDVEVVVIDDGSTDGTRECLRDAGLLERVQYVSQPNQGVSVARNHGIAVSSGRYLCFLDSDDLLRSTFARTVMEALRRDGCRIGYCAYQYFFDAPERPLMNIRYPTYSGWVGGRIISEHFIPTTGVVLVDRDAMGATRFHPGLRNTQDWYFWAELMLREKVCFVDEILVDIRFRTDSLSKSKERVAKAVVHSLELIEALVARHRASLSSRDVGMFYYRFSSALIEVRDFRRALTAWKKAASGHPGAAAHAKLGAKLGLELLYLRRRVELALWNRRQRPGIPSGRVGR